MDVIVLLAIALSSYYVHDTLQLGLAALMKRRREDGSLRDFPADITSYFNVQRIALTLVAGFGWSSERNFLYRDSHNFYWGRRGVFLVHLVSPVIYLTMSISGFWLALLLPLPIVMRTMLLRWAIFNVGMTMLMLIPIPPLSMGNALFSFYSKVGYEHKRAELEFYGNMGLVVLILLNRLVAVNILPLATMQEWFLQLLVHSGIVKFS